MSNAPLDGDSREQLEKWLRQGNLRAKCLFSEFKDVMEHHGFQPIKRSDGHWQVRVSPTNPMVINWWPYSDKQTVHVSEVNCKYYHIADVSQVLKLAYAFYRPTGDLDPDLYK
jgi:hypothetical protein